MKSLKPKSFLTKGKRRLFKFFLFPTTPLFIAFGIMFKSKPTLYMTAITATISAFVLLADWIVRKRTVGNSNVGKNPTADQRRNLR